MRQGTDRAGLDDSSEFGPTLARDHLTIDTRWSFREPERALLKALALSRTNK
jgi:hypothetical protein